MSYHTSTPPTRSSWTRLWPWLAVLVLAVAVAWGGHKTVIPGITGWINDDGLYVDTAQALLQGKGFVTTIAPHIEPAFRYPIMFPALLALVGLGAHSFTEALLRMQWVGPVCDGLWAVLVFVYMRRFAGWTNRGALAAAVLASCHPIVATVVGFVLSDLPTAVAGLAAVLVFELAWQRNRAWPFAACGVLLVGVCLMRYEQAALALAMLLALACGRRWKGFVAFLGAFAVAFVPWVVYRAHAGGEEYSSTLGFLLQKPPALLFHSLSAIAATLLSHTLPCLVVPCWPSPLSLSTLLAGTLVSAVVLLGAVAALLRPREGESRLAPLYVVLVVGLVLVWMIRYVTTADFASNRMLLPLVPFVLVLFVRGLLEVRARYAALERLPLRRMLVFAAAVVVALTGNGYFRWANNPDRQAMFRARAIGYQQTFDYLRDKVPANAVLASLNAPAVYLHSGHPCVGFDYTITDAQLLTMLSSKKVDYLVGLPFLLQAPPWLHTPNGEFDAAVTIINDLVKQHPGLLKPVYFNLGGRIGVFAIDKAVLAAALKHPKL